MTKAIDRHASAVFGQRFLQLLQDRLPVSRVVHINKVQDDDATQIAQTQLAGQGNRCFQVCFEDRVVKVATTDETAGIHIHRSQGFGLIDNQIAAGLQIYPTRQGAIDFFIHMGCIKQSATAFVVTDALKHRGRVNLCPLLHLLHDGA